VEIVANMVGHNDLISGIVFTPDGNTVVTGSADGQVLRWDLSAFR
jgi:WD40 repeat protein